MKIVTLHEGLPPQGLSEAQRAGVFFVFLVPNPPRGRPIGGGGIHRTRVEQWGNNPALWLNSTIKFENAITFSSCIDVSHGESCLFS